jgi:hypothetical protein
MVAIEATLVGSKLRNQARSVVRIAQSTMSAGVPWHEIVPVPRGWLSEKNLAARLGEDFSLDIPFHRTGFI